MKNKNLFVVLFLFIVILCLFYKITIAGQWELILPVNERYTICGMIETIIIHPTNPDTMYVLMKVDWGMDGNKTRLLKTTDGGQSWYDLWKGLDDNFYNNYNGRWLNLTLDYSGGDFHPLIMDPKRPNILYLFSGCLDFGSDCSKAGVFRSTDSGEHWEWWDYTPENPRGLPNKIIELYIRPDSTNILYGSTYDSTGSWLYKSINRGENWVKLVSSIYGLPDIINPDSVNVWYIASDEMLKSTDAGESWFRLFQVWRAVRSGVLDTMETTNLYIGTDGKGIYRSRDAGKTWNECNNGIPNPGCLMIEGILISPLDHNIIYAIGRDNPYCSNVNSVVLKSTNGGDNWIVINEGLPIGTDSTTILIPEAIAFSPQKNTIYAGFWREDHCGNPEGLWRYVDGTINVEEKNDKKNNILTSSTINLRQNYPNPFTSNNVQISFYLPKETFVKLQVYNLQGQLVRTILNSNKHSGNYTVSWDGKNDQGVNCPNGIYLYRLFTSTFSQTKKLVLIK